MARALALFAVVLLCRWAGADEPDNRQRFQPVTVLPFMLRDEVEVLNRITVSHDQGLLKALALPPEGQNGVSFRLKWNQRIALKDADYILCLFDSEGHVFPGDNPRVLVLFSLDYQVVTWGKFTCEPFFGYGSIFSPLVQPNTYLVTVNPSGRFGGALWFEQYLITPQKIEKMGEGPEYPVQPKRKLEAKDAP